MTAPDSNGWPCKKGSEVWEEVPDQFVACKWTRKLRGPYFVMGKIDNYLMVRRKGCMPVTMTIKSAKRPPTGNPAP